MTSYYGRKICSFDTYADRDGNQGVFIPVNRERTVFNFMNYAPMPTVIHHRVSITSILCMESIYRKIPTPE